MILAFCLIFRPYFGEYYDCSGIVHDQWTRFNRLSPDKFIIAMFQLLYHSLHQPKKDTDGNCKLAVETLNLSSKSVFITRSHCFHFVLLVHQCRESLIS